MILIVKLQELVLKFGFMLSKILKKVTSFHMTMDLVLMKIIKIILAGVDLKIVVVT